MRVSTLLTTAFAAVLIATTVDIPGAGETSQTTTPVAATQPSVTRVVGVSIDGLNPAAIRKLGRKKTPTLHRLTAQGASTLNARTEYELTSTLPNHTGMLTGRPVSGTAGHGVTRNVDTGKTVSSAAGDEVASVFDVVHEAGGTTALYAGKSKFALFDRTWPTAVDRFAVRTNGPALTALVVRGLRQRPATFTFVHFAMPDRAGHASGYMGRAYLHAVRRTDRFLGRIIKTINQTPSIRGSTAVIVTADHGGRHGHRVATDPENYTVPFLLWGPGVARGVDLYSLNPGYARPRRSRIDYTPAKQPIRNGNLANVATQLLGLDAVPGSVFGATHPILTVR